ncbi:uncharacterized protein FIBRA_04881 [Fibroporia radiculosa]|uniref:Fungal-type protein kinase domain-containing protein n=1 Tax=Fibroporia radiculosa TaxID=599839 RepID=J4G840_9APHY|nr:uncharacterized protein FIBRA_04881 [Fibroporia radiculosa]CCM02773.1 predicted protein [Fibroporia radiculosa]
MEDEILFHNVGENTVVEREIWPLTLVSVPRDRSTTADAAAHADESVLEKCVSVPDVPAEDATREYKRNYPSAEIGDRRSRMQLYWHFVQAGALSWQFQSALVLVDRNREVEVSDTLESFIHILLYCSVRYLRHNIGDVPEFLRGNFGDATRNVSRRQSRNAKLAIIHKGVIPPNEKDAVSLHFDPESHPFNHIFKQLLLICRESYWRAAFDSPILARVLNQQICGKALPKSASETRSVTNTATTTIIHAPLTIASADDPGRDRLEEAMANSHDKMRRNHFEAEMAYDRFLLILESMLRDAERWPENDRIGDQMLTSKEVDDSR